MLALLLAAGCASVPGARLVVSPEAQAARELIDAHRQQVTELRTRADLTIRRGERVQRLSGVLLTSAPASLRFEALAPLGVPLLVVAGGPGAVTVWDVLEDRAWIAPPSPEFARQWLGVNLGGEDLVAVLSGGVRLLRDPTAVALLSPDTLGPSLDLANGDDRQRVWFDPATGAPRQVEWTGGRYPARVVLTHGNGAPTGLTLTTLDGRLEVRARYRDPQVNGGVEPALFDLRLPERVRIQDFR